MWVAPKSTLDGCFDGVFMTVARRSKMTLDAFHREMAALSRDAGGRRPFAQVLGDYAKLERTATRRGVESFSDITIRRWIAAQAAIVAERRSEPFEVVGLMMLRTLMLGFASPYDKYVAVGLFADYCETIGGKDFAKHCMWAALTDIESDPRFETEWKAYVEATLPPELKRRAGTPKDDRHSWDNLIGLAESARQRGRERPRKRKQSSRT